MLLLLKRLLRFSIPIRNNLATPTLREHRNDPNKPRVRNGGVEVKPRNPTPTIP